MICDETQAVSPPTHYWDGRAYRCLDAREVYAGRCSYATWIRLEGSPDPVGLLQCGALAGLDADLR